MSRLEQLRNRKDEILRLVSAAGAKNLRVFGSAMRGEETGISDVDFLVDLEPGRSLLDLGALQVALHDLLDCEVDVLTSGFLHPTIRQQILASAVPL